MFEIINIYTATIKADKALPDAEGDAQESHIAGSGRDLSHILDVANAAHGSYLASIGHGRSCAAIDAPTSGAVFTTPLAL